MIFFQLLHDRHNCKGLEYGHVCVQENASCDDLASIPQEEVEGITKLTFCTATFGIPVLKQLGDVFPNVKHQGCTEQDSQISQGTYGGPN